MSTYTVSFFGHEDLDVNIKDFVKHRVFLLLEDIVKRYDQVIFLTGTNRGFENVAAEAINDIKLWVKSDNSTFYLILHDMDAYYEKFVDRQADHYDAIEICEQSLNCYRQVAVYVKNEIMIDRSDLVVFFLKEDTGYAYDAYEYAVKEGKNVINVADELTL